MEMKFQKVKSIHFSIPKKDDEKTWVIVEFENGTKWMPGLVDVGHICSFIGKCEDLKYFPKGRGHLYTKDFINKCYGKQRSEIVKIYDDQYNPNKLGFSK